MNLNKLGLKNESAWQNADVKLPGYDTEKMCQATDENPVWVHFGAGNIFRGFIARLHENLLENSLASSGIIAAETFDSEIIDKIYKPCDNLTLLVELMPDGSVNKEIIASIAKGVKADGSDSADIAYLKKAFENKSLQMASFTITEKGYSLSDIKGELLAVVKEDIEKGPESAKHAMSIVAALMLARFNAGAYPMALVSMDNCSHNGDKLRQSVLKVSKAWVENGNAPQQFYDYISDESRVAFPWTMIDKITPRPDGQIGKMLAEADIENMDTVITSRNTYIAPFVNAEKPGYLVIEDSFPNGRPALEKAGAYMTNRDTVNNTERMKVTTCLNPLHTALAVFGCLLGFDRISAEMKDADLKKLVEIISFKEGMPVVVHPGIIDPADFIKEVMDMRLPNPYIPDTPQRIAADTSQKVGIRFGETIKSYVADAKLDVKSLTCIPLAIAGWMRYILAVDDEGSAFEPTSDPMLGELTKALSGVKYDDASSYKGELKELLANPVLFGIDLWKAGLGEKIEGMFIEMLAGKGSVRSTLKKYTQA